MPKTPENLAASAKTTPPMLKLVLDLGPLAVFFIAYRFGGLMAATAALMAATLLALTLTYWLEKTVAVMPLVTAVMVGVFGALTLILHDELFIKMKPTIVNCLFASILLGGWCFKKPMLKYLLGQALSMSEKGWLILSVRWGFFFLFLAGLNEYIWRTYSTDFWVDFKVFGMFTCTILFTALQIPLMKREMLPDPSEK